MLFLHLEEKLLMTLTTALYLPCPLISGHLAIRLLELTSRPEASVLPVSNRAIKIICRESLSLRMPVQSPVRLLAVPVMPVRAVSVFRVDLVLPAVRIR